MTLKELIGKKKIANPVNELAIFHQFEIPPTFLPSPQAEPPSTRPKILFLDNPVDVARIAHEIGGRKRPVVFDYGATYGTTFAPRSRENVAKVRGEIAPYETVSVVTTRKVASGWVDQERIHPDVAQSIKDGGLNVLDGVSFIRFPCNQKCEADLGPDFVNAKKEVQVFIVPESDPLMSSLKSGHNLKAVGVRSANMSGHEEERFIVGALQYARKIGAAIVAVRNPKTILSQIKDEKHLANNQPEKMQRKRYGSQPIVRLPTADETPAAITLIRAGNTEPTTIRRLVSKAVPEKVDFVHANEKKTTFVRAEFSVDSKVALPGHIRKVLVKNSGVK